MLAKLSTVPSTATCKSRKADEKGSSRCARDAKAAGAARDVALLLSAKGPAAPGSCTVGSIVI